MVSCVHSEGHVLGDPSEGSGNPPYWLKMASGAARDDYFVSLSEFGQDPSKQTPQDPLWGSVPVGCQVYLVGAASFQIKTAEAAANPSGTQLTFFTCLACP